MHSISKFLIETGCSPRVLSQKKDVGLNIGPNNMHIYGQVPGSQEVSVLSFVKCVINI